MTSPSRKKCAVRRCIPRAILHRITQETLTTLGTGDMLVSNKAVDALHTAAEAYMEDIFMKTTLLPGASKRPTLQLPCMQAIIRLCGDAR